MVTPNTDTPINDGSEGTPTPGSTTEGSGDETDYKALYEQSKTELDKSQRDLSSVKGQIRSQGELTNMYDTRLGGLEKSFGALAKAQAAGNFETLEADISTINQEAQNQAEEKRSQAQYQVMLDELTEIVKGPDGEPLFDLQKADEGEKVRDLWKVGFEGDGGKMPWSQRMDYLRQAQQQAHIVSRDMERNARTQAKETAQESLGNDSGSTGSGGAENWDSLKTKRPKDMNPKEKKEHLNKLWSAFETDTGQKYQR